MANDASNHPTNSSDADMSGDHAEFDAVQLAQANTPQQPQQPQKTAAAAIPAVPNGTVHVNVPQGEKVVRVAVANGETVVLPAPFDDQGALAGKEGNGNLAIKVGDITVILEGYQQTVDASGNPTVTLEDAQGDKIDIATVLASTDPNLDIETAAGPAGAQGADNTGALLSAFDGAAGLGGLNAVGVLDATALQYKLIDNAIRLDRDDLLTPETPLTFNVHNPLDKLNQSFLRDPIVRLSDYGNIPTFEDFIKGKGTVPAWDNHFADFDGTKAGQGDMHVTGSIVVDPNNDSTVNVTLTKEGLEAQNLTSNGVPLFYVVSQDGTTIFGFRGDGSSETSDGALILVIHVADVGTKNADGTTTFIVDYYMTNRLDDVTGTGETTHLNVNFQITTTADQTASGATGVDYADDAPIAKDDTDSVANHLTTDGNVETGVGTNEGKDGKGADLEGADGSTVTDLVGKNGADHNNADKLTVKGEFGTLVMNADGTYTYTRDNDAPTVDKDGKTITLQDKFTYTLTDDDGDKTTANLTIDIRDNPVIVTPPPPPGGGDNPIDLNKSGTAVFESGLPDGSDPTKDTETTKGSVKVDAKDGIDTITVTDKDGNPHEVKLDGTPTTITGNHGDIILTWDKANNEIDYTYTLKDNDLDHSKQGNDIVPGEDFKVVVTDGDGDKGTGDINIVIVDDVPDAKNDTDTLKVGETTQTGNVITGEGTTEGKGGTGTDVLGADGATVSAVVGAKSSDSDASDGLTVQGNYGKLELHADGSYTYTRDPGSPGGVQDVFIYTLKDKDGDTDQATLTINVGDDRPTVHVPTIDGQTTVYEKGLPQGSGELADGNSANDSDKSEKVSGTITYTEGDAPASITITDKDGKAVTVVAGATIVGADGTLHIDSVSGGNINYTYTLTTNTSGDATHDDFKISITDKDGDNVTDTLKINIVDDVPTAHNDTDGVGNLLTTDGNVVTGVGTTSGDAGKDLLGADGATVSAVVGAKSSDSDASDGLTVQGQYGKLELKADGSYTYTRDTDAPLKADDKFTYTVKDGDGDTSTATLTININDNPVIVTPPPPPGGGDNPIDLNKSGTAVFESGLPDGSKSADDTETTKGSVKVDAKDGISTITVDGHDVKLDGTPTTFSGKHGDITLTWDKANNEIDYTYTLKDNDLDHSKQGNDIVPGEDFKVVVTDSDGDKGNGDINIVIVDDVPTAKNDTDVVDNATNTATGNVVTGADTTSGAAGKDVLGADGASVTAVVSNATKASDTNASDGLTVQGQYGKLELHADGSYTYTRDPGTPGGASESFTYTLTDKDGDTSTATLTVGIDDKTPEIHAPTADGQTTVNEKGLPQGSGEMADGNSANDSDKSEKVSGTITYNEGDAPASITIQGKDGPVNVVVGATIVGADGTMVITSVGGGNIGYTYTLTTNTSGDATHDDFKISITDKDGDNATDTLVVKIVDDVPTAKADTDLVSNDTNTATGNVITGVGTTTSPLGVDVKGADGAAVSGISSVNVGGADNTPGNGLSIVGQYGTLTMGTDGQYTYTRFNDAPLKATDVFNYTLTDGDGDTSTTTLSVKIDDGGCEITNLTPKASGGDTMVDEDGLLASRGVGESAGSDGSGPTHNTGDFTITAPDGVQTLAVDGHNVIANGVFVGGTWTTALGNTISVTSYDSATGKVSYNYTLNDNENHPSANGENSLYEDLNVKLTDKDGDTANGTLSVNIVDDVAVAVDGTKALTGTDQKTNVLLILDISGSMGEDSGVDNPNAPGNYNKLQLEGQTIINLLNSYAAAGQTMVQIATFSTDAAVPNLAGGWMTVSDAIALVNQIVQQGPQGATDYHDAIAAGLQAFATDGKIVGADNVAYFFSDGQPNEPTDAQGPLTQTEINNWVKFAQDNDVNSYAIGLGSGTVQSQLDPIAYNGQTNTNTDAHIVTNLNDLAAVINSTLPTPQSGDIVSSLGGTFGADGGHVASITLNGITYTYAQAVAANAAHELTITTAGGKFVIDMDDGHYTYTPDFSKTQSNLDFSFTLIDNDGDQASAHLKLLAPLPQFTTNLAEPTITTTHDSWGTGNYTAPSGTTAGDHIRDWTSGGNVNDVHNSTINGNNGNDWIEAGAGNDTVHGNTGLDKILGGDGNDNLQGDSGNDWLDGGAGNDFLQGGDDSDKMIGGAGSDKMDGGNGTDYFLKVDVADLDGTNTLDGTHTINGGAGDDYVDLSGIANFGTAQAARLENVEALSFTGNGANTVTLDVTSVLNMTDDRNNLVIHGDQGSDTVNLTGGFSKIGTDVTANDGQHYDVFQAGSGANQVTVFVDHALNATAN